MTFTATVEPSMRERAWYTLAKFPRPRNFVSWYLPRMIRDGSDGGGDGGDCCHCFILFGERGKERNGTVCLWRVFSDFFSSRFCEVFRLKMLC